MSDADESTTQSGLSFERAEFENQQEPTLVCGYCKKPLSVQYWQIAKRPACADCRGVVQRELEAGKSLNRFLGALGYGVLAAIAGCAGWVLVTKVVGYQIGLVAIGIGYLVGKAVRKGAGGQGGTRYQVLATFLTYSAIALARLPEIIELTNTPQTPGLSWWAALLIAYEAPFLGGVQNIIGLFIIGIGLYEAWKLTRAIPFYVLGPFSIESSPAAELAAAPDAAH
jgi:hypothetical protein